MGDDEPCKIVGNDKIKIKLYNGNQWLLKQVRNIPNFRRNIISVRRLGSEFYTITIYRKFLGGH